MSYQCLRTNGSGYASITDASQAGLDMGLSDFMVEGWIKTSTDYTGTAGYIFCRWDLTNGIYLLRIDGDNQLYAYIDDRLGNSRTIEGSMDVNDGKWHYVVFVADRSANGYIYFDGLSDGSGSITVVGSINPATPFSIGDKTGGGVNIFTGQFDEVRVWNFGYGGLPSNYAAYITWRATGRNVFKDISLFNSGSWNIYADAVRTELHDEAGAVAGMVVGKKYGYVTATPHTLDYGDGTLDDDGVFVATHTTGTITDGDADDHVRRVGLTARYKFEGDYLDEGSNNNDLTAGGSGNVFPGYTLRKRKSYMPFYRGLGGG